MYLKNKGGEGGGGWGQIERWRDGKINVETHTDELSPVGLHSIFPICSFTPVLIKSTEMRISPCFAPMLYLSVGGLMPASTLHLAASC